MAARSALCAGLYVPSEDHSPAHTETPAQQHIVSETGHSDGENKKEGPCKKYPSPQKFQATLSIQTLPGVGRSRTILPADF